MSTQSNSHTCARMTTSPVRNLAIIACLTIASTVPFASGAPRLVARRPPAAATPAAVSEPQQIGAADAFGRLPMAFEINEGQTDPSVQFLARGSGYAVFLTPHEAVLALKRSAPADADQRAERRAVRLKFVGADRDAIVVGEMPLEGRVNYMTGGDPAAWRTDIETYSRVRYTDVWRGVDMVYYGNQGELEYDFVAAPGGDVGAIRLSIEGADGTSVDAAGDLVLRLGDRELRQRRPSVYQESLGGERVPVSCRYELDGDGNVGLDVGAYDVTLPLVVDPVLSYATYLGGYANNSAPTTTGNGITVDASGNIYVTGTTEAANFPTSPLALQPANAGLSDVFVTKIAPGDGSVVYSTFFGGIEDDTAADIAVDASGAAYVTGNTRSTNFPTLNPLPIATNPLGFDAFVTKLAPSGNALVYSTLLGGTSNVDQGTAIQVDASGSAFVVGRTASNNFPTVNPLFGDTDGYGNADVFVSKLTPAGNALTYSTYVGTTGFDEALDVAIDAAGAAYVTGRTQSTSFPTVNPLFGDTDGFGSNDSFVFKLAPAGNMLVFSTYLGGSGVDDVRSIAVDASGSAYVVGSTTSTNFPTVNPLFGDTDGFGNNDAFVTKLAPTGSTIVYSTYLGGSGTDLGNGVAVDAAGNAFVSGSTDSTNFPTTNPLFGDTNGFGGTDVFVTKLTPAGNAIVNSTYIGGSATESPRSFAVDASGAAYVTGQTVSPDFPTVNPILGDTNGFGSGDAFVTKLAPAGNSLAFSTYLGGTRGLSENEFALGIAVDAAGSAYITGGTDAVDFPTANPLFGDTDGFGGLTDVFVTKLSPAGNSVVYSTYLGGSAGDAGIGIAVAASGNAIITGNVSSTNFPTVSPIAGDTNGFGGQDAFVAKLSAAGNALVYSTYLGGTNLDGGRGVAIDAAGNAYVTGVATAGGFPVLNPLFGDTDGFGGNDAFVTKLGSTGAVVYSTFLGGSASDGGDSIAVDAAGSAYVTGTVNSTDFPTASPLLGDTNGFGSGDAFVTKLSPGGNAIVFSSYLGGSNLDGPAGIAVDAIGSVYVCGETSSADFPTANALFGSIGGTRDAFLTKLTPAGNAFAFSTFLGGSNADFGGGVALDATGNVYVTGRTLSTNFPVVDPLLGDANGFGGLDAFVTKLTPSGNAIVFSTYYGGAGDEASDGIATDPAGNVYISGTTESANLPLQSPFDPSLGSTADAFVAKFSDCAISCPANMSVSNDPSQCGAVVAYPAPITTGSCGTVTCSPPSGSVFQVGTTTVNCSSQAGPSCSFTVTVVDTEAPVLTCQANIVRGNDTSQCGATVSYGAPTVTDNCGSGVGKVICSPASGSSFPVGTTTLTCSATDGAGNRGSCSFTVTINDTQAPTIACPANVVAPSAPGLCSATVSYAAPTISDNCSGATVVCTPPSGSTFVKGVTAVSCIATDAAGNTATCGFTVTVNDTEAPAIACASNVTADATTLQGGGPGTVVTFAAPTASDNCSSVGAPTCSPASGSFFAVGTTTVTCSVADAAGNTGTCAFTVTVIAPFDVCVVDDATGDTLSLVTNTASPLYRLWQLRIAATNATVVGSAESLVAIPRRSLTAYDHDNATYRMDLSINYNTQTATGTVKKLANGVTTLIRDRDVTNNGPCR